MGEPTLLRLKPASSKNLSPIVKCFSAPSRSPSQKRDIVCCKYAYALLVALPSRRQSSSALSASARDVNRSPEIKAGKDLPAVQLANCLRLPLLSARAAGRSEASVVSGATHPLVT